MFRTMVYSALRNAREADDKWHDALVTKFGRDAVAARYSALGVSSVELLALKNTKLEADQKAREAIALQKRMTKNG